MVLSPALCTYIFAFAQCQAISDCFDVFALNQLNVYWLTP